MKKRMYFSLLGMLLLVACGKDNGGDPSDCSSTSYTYTNDIKAIFNSNCSIIGCHSTSAQAGGHDLSTYQGIITTGTSKIIAAIEHTGGVPMPYNLPKLPDATIQKIKCWVEQGAVQ